MKQYTLHIVTLINMHYFNQSSNSFVIFVNKIYHSVVVFCPTFLSQQIVYECIEVMTIDNK